MALQCFITRAFTLHQCFSFTEVTLENILVTEFSSIRRLIWNSVSTNNNIYIKICKHARGHAQVTEVVTNAWHACYYQALE